MPQLVNYNINIQLFLPSVRQEVDFNVGVSRSAVVSNGEFFGAEDSDDQLMTNFIVPQLYLHEEKQHK